ncbi:hypothetical protein [Azohydromonas australica]|uniref:hypothetical protein n=1 Tax=Azohydromonas australica TaxID=364039 RepID=UPI0012EC3B49|nr:hypothetical protein [Azohydromonas australica]
MGRAVTAVLRLSSVRVLSLHQGCRGASWLVEQPGSAEPGGYAIAEGHIKLQSRVKQPRLLTHENVTAGAMAQGIESYEASELDRALRAWALHVNVHIDKLPAGEVRAQLRVTEWWSSTQEHPSDLKAPPHRAEGIARANWAAADA